MHRLKDYLPEEAIHGEASAQDIAAAISGVFQKRYTLQAPIWAELHKIKAAIDLFLADPDNKEQANTAVKRLLKKEPEGAEHVTVAGCAMRPDRFNTAHYAYDDCNDPQLGSIYAAIDGLKAAEREREETLRETDPGRNLPVTLFSVDTSEGDAFKLPKRPGRTAFKGVQVRLPTVPL